MVGQRQVFLHFSKLVGQNHVERVFLPVDGFGFHRAVDLAESHRCRVGVQCLDPVQVDRVGDDANLQASQVFHLVDGAL